MHPPLKGTVSEKIFIESVMPQFHVRKSDKIIKKTHDFYAEIEQNLWENDYRACEKLRRIGQVKLLTEKAEAETKKRHDKQKEENRLKNVEQISLRRAQSANRSNSRRVEQVNKKALLLVSSSQQMNEEQKRILSKQQLQEDEIRKIILSRSGQLSHIICKGGENSWNRLDKSSRKQLSNFYPEHALKKEQDGIDNIKKRKDYDDKLQQERDKIVQENKSEIRKIFSQRQMKNRQISELLGKQKKKQQQSAEYQEIRPCSPLFERLSKPKENVQKDLKELPEFREFISNQINYLDYLKNPILAQFMEKINGVNPSSRKDPTKYIRNSIDCIKVKPEPNEKYLMDTIDHLNEEKFETCFENQQVMKDLDDFDAQIGMKQVRIFLKKQNYFFQKIECFSKIKNEESNYLKNTEGFKKLKEIKKHNDQYRIEIGNELRTQVFYNKNKLNT